MKRLNNRLLPFLLSSSHFTLHPSIHRPSLLFTLYTPSLYSPYIHHPSLHPLYTTPPFLHPVYTLPRFTFCSPSLSSPSIPPPSLSSPSMLPPSLYLLYSLLLFIFYPHLLHSTFILRTPSNNPCSVVYTSVAPNYFTPS